MKDDTEDVLNDLIENLEGRREGIHEGRGRCTRCGVESLFAECARRCREGRRRAQAQVRGLGGSPEKSGSAAGALHRGWLSVREAVFQPRRQGDS